MAILYVKKGRFDKACDTLSLVSNIKGHQLELVPSRLMLHKLPETVVSNGDKTIEKSGVSSWGDGNGFDSQSMAKPM